MFLMIDNYDSFVYNLKAYFEELGREIMVRRSDQINIEEIENSKKALEILGGKIEKIEEITLPNSDIKRNIIIVKKVNKTPAKYPRKAGIPSKEPL